jgi:hypothetical protein
MAVNDGLTASMLGKTLVSTTKRLSRADESAFRRPHPSR